MAETMRQYYQRQMAIMENAQPPVHPGCSDCFFNRFRFLCMCGSFFGTNNITRNCREDFTFKADLTNHIWLGPFRTTIHPKVSVIHATDVGDDSHVG